MKAREDENIFILGDASIAGDMPKSAFAANSQAQVVAQMAVAELMGAEITDARYANRCWSLISADNSVFVAGKYKPDTEEIKQIESDVSVLDESATIRQQNYVDSASWYVNLTSELYG